MFNAHNKHLTWLSLLSLLLLFSFLSFFHFSFCNSYNRTLCTRVFFTNNLFYFVSSLCHLCTLASVNWQNILPRFVFCFVLVFFSLFFCFFFHVLRVIHSNRKQFLFNERYAYFMAVVAKSSQIKKYFTNSLRMT